VQAVLARAIERVQAQDDVFQAVDVQHEAQVLLHRQLADA